MGAGQTPGETIGNGRASAILYAREGAKVMVVASLLVASAWKAMASPVAAQLSTRTVKVPCRNISFGRLSNMFDFDVPVRLK
jgi:hypothetical protein